MRRFHFRLERVLRLKQQRLHLAELRLQQARLTLDAALARVQTLEGELAQVAVVLSELVKGTSTSGSWLAASAHTAQLSRAMQEAATWVAKAENDVREAATTRIQRAAETEALLHLRVTAWEVHRDEATASEQKRLDEEGLRRWQVHRGQGPSAEPTSEGE